MDGYRSYRKIQAVNAVAYLKRIGLKVHSPGASFLKALHYHHLLTIPYENLDFHYKKRVILKVDSLFDKIIIRNRGGIAYELNILFYHLLHQLNFKVRLLSAEFLNNSHLTNPFDHVVVLVLDVDGNNYLCDVGQNNSFQYPKLLKEGISHLDNTHYYKFEQDINENWILQKSTDNSHFNAIYQFTLHPKEMIEFIPRCNDHQDQLDGPFLQEKFISQLFKIGRITLTSRKLITNLYGELKEKDILNEDEFLVHVEQYFGIRKADLLRQLID